MKNIGVFAFIVVDNKILLVKKNYGKREWILPGGAVELGERLEIALKREVKEETNQEVKDLEFIGVFYNQPKYELAFCYIVSLIQLTQIQWNADELERVEFFSFNNLPTDLSRLNRVRIDYYLQYNNGAHPQVIST